MVIIFFLCWLLSSIVAAFLDIKISIAILCVYHLLVPYSTFSSLGVPFEYNYATLCVFIIFIIKVIWYEEKFDYTIVKPFAIFTGIVIFCSFFAGDFGFGEQLSSLRLFVLSNFILPIIIWQTFRQKKDIDYLINVIIICMVIMGLYGIYCFISKSNPYVTTLSAIFKVTDQYSIFAENERGGLTGRVQSTTFHPFLWSALLFMILIAVNLFTTKRGIKYISLCILLIANLLVCNVRTGIFSLLVGFIILMGFGSLKSRAILIGGFLVVFVLGGIDTSVFGKYKAIADSIIYFYDSSKASIGGSSYKMRHSQLEGAIQLWYHGGLLFGNGFGWCINYYKLYGDHPVLLAFESLIYVAIIENGLMGIILWGSLFYNMARINYFIYVFYERKSKYNYWVINSLISGYLIFSLITGTFGFSFFLILLVLMFRKIIDDNDKKITNDRVNCSIAK